MARLLIVLLALVPGLVCAAEAEDAAAVASFQGHLDHCKQDEIRCVWFLHDYPRVGMVMTIDLKQSSVFTVREVYEHASQDSAKRTLSHTQIETLKKITADMPRSDDKVEFRKAVCVSLQKEGKVQVFRYNRRHPPAVIQRLYDIGGGYYDDSDDP